MRVGPSISGMAAVVLLSASVSCTPVTRSYEIHTGQLGCEEANRHVHDALVSMGMIITAFRLAAPETDGYVRASKTDNRGIRKGEVRISCTASGVSIVASEAGLTLGSEHEFERGVFLSVTARARLTVDRGRILPAQAADQAAPQSAPIAVAQQPVRAKPKPRVEKVVGVVVRLEPLRGFATLLDFEADLSRAGILPVRVTVANGTARSYEFDPRDIVLRRAGSRRRAYTLSPNQAGRMLEDANREILVAQARKAGPEADTEVDLLVLDPMAPTELGDIRAAAKIIRERLLRGGLLRANGRFEGYLYFEVAEYDRARITMIDTATGETEGFIVEF